MGLNIKNENYLEAAVRVDDLKSDHKSATFDLFMNESGIAIVPISEEKAIRARRADRRHGEGNPAAELNLRDGFAHALSKAREEPLLFKTDDSCETDVEAAL